MLGRTGLAMSQRHSPALFAKHARANLGTQLLAVHMFSQPNRRRTQPIEY